MHPAPVSRRDGFACKNEESAQHRKVVIQNKYGKNRPWCTNTVTSTLGDLNDWKWIDWLNSYKKSTASKALLRSPTQSYGNKLMMESMPCTGNSEKKGVPNSI
ncbi:hypothetical protein KY285_026737 [Solanum tuberosum]|nr:hypothetical protein KY284_026772 [Solanum tuberosum]KAH0665531.1 hypothetical protein KY285_026737 [Solanum tuberosum]